MRWGSVDKGEKRKENDSAPPSGRSREKLVRFVKIGKTLERGEERRRIRSVRVISTRTECSELRGEFREKTAQKVGETLRVAGRQQQKQKQPRQEE